MTERHLGASRIAGPDACRRVLLVGELNPYGADADYALYYEPETSAGGRLQRLILGLPARHWYLPIWRVNLCAGAWDQKEARIRARELLADGAPWSTVIMLGEKPRTAFETAADSGPMPMMFGATRPLSNLARSAGGVETFIALPHPSGRNQRAYDRANIERARSLLREVLPEIPWGTLDEEKSA